MKLRNVGGRYAAWCRKRGGTLQCSPALGVVAAIVVFAIVCYVYREVIITTIEVAALAAASAVALGIVLAVTISTLRWYRKHQRKVAAGTAEPAAYYEEVKADAERTTDEAVSDISREADWLADAGAELVFDSEGNLHAKAGKKS